MGGKRKKKVKRLNEEKKKERRKKRKKQKGFFQQPNWSQVMASSFLFLVQKTSKTSYSLQYISFNTLFSFYAFLLFLNRLLSLMDIRKKTHALKKQNIKKQCEGDDDETFMRCDKQKTFHSHMRGVCF